MKETSWGLLVGEEYGMYCEEEFWISLGEPQWYNFCLLCIYLSNKSNKQINFPWQQVGEMYLEFPLVYAPLTNVLISTYGPYQHEWMVGILIFDFFFTSSCLLYNPFLMSHCTPCKISCAKIVIIYVASTKYIGVFIASIISQLIANTQPTYVHYFQYTIWLKRIFYHQWLWINN